MNRLLTTDRDRQSTATHTSLLSATQSDRARLIYSAAFRRLQQKAQVFSLESNSAVRSRLTHSIEVSHIGRYLTATICEKINKNGNFSDEIKAYWNEHNLAIANVVEISCLAHDIGNPPFGHFGEAAIVEWAYSEGIEKAILKSLTQDKITLQVKNKILEDFFYFDGNPQGLRILTKLQGEDGFYGLNLTYSQLAAFMKYTFGSSDKTSEKSKERPFSKKIGFFETEREILERAWDKLEMGSNNRHPLGFLMEASDDISYCVSDIEDGIEKEIISFEHFKNEVTTGLKKLQDKHPHNHSILDSLISKLNERQAEFPIGSFLGFKTQLSNFLVDQVSDKFVELYSKLLSFEVTEPLISKKTIEYAILEVLREYTTKYLFTSYEAEKMELSGFAIIKGILDEYQKLISLTKEQFSHLILQNQDKMRECKLSIERRLYNRLPKKHISAYKTAIANKPINKMIDEFECLTQAFEEISNEKELHLRLHLIVDFVSGMTDQFSMEIYQLIKGINIR